MSSCQPCMFVLASGGSQGHPMTPNTMSLLYDNSSAHGIFTFHIGIRCSTLDCMSIWFTFLAAGMYLKNTLEYLGQAHHIRRAVVHPRLQYLLGLPLVSHMSRVKCFVSILLCSLFFFHTPVWVSPEYQRAYVSSTFCILEIHAPAFVSHPLVRLQSAVSYYSMDFLFCGVALFLRGPCMRVRDAGGLQKPPNLINNVVSWH